MPDDVKMNPSTSVSGGTCSKWSCPGNLATESEITFVIPSEIPANTEIIIDIVGIDNPRTTRPTGTFRVTTYTQEKDVID